MKSQRMNISDLKIELINRIIQLKDAEIIENIQEMLDFEMSVSEYILNNAQRKRIAEAQEEYRKGAYLTEDEANKNLP